MKLIRNFVVLVNCVLIHERFLLRGASVVCVILDFVIKCGTSSVSSLVRASFGSRSCAPYESGRTKKMITGYLFSCTKR